MIWCPTCGAQGVGAVHNCGTVSITKDRLRELEEIERKMERPNA